MKEHIEISSLGWGPFFEQQISDTERQNCLAARVTAAHKYSFVLATESGLVSAVMAGKELDLTQRHPDLPAVGDWVLAKPPEGGTAVIVRRLERSSELVRRRPVDRNSNRINADKQVLAANLNYVFIVTSLNQDLNTARLERALTMVWNSGATPVVLLSKADLCQDAQARAEQISLVSAGADVYCISSLKGQGLQAVLDHLKSGITGCLIGSSGAGKTTLINALCGTSQITRSIREDDDKGRHATTARELFFLPGGGMLIDTPGLREIGLMDDTDLSAAFSDITDLTGACRYADCAHLVEPGCAVLAALENGALDRERYQRYVKLRKEMEYQESRSSPARQLESKRKEKQFGRMIKNYNKNR